jgi:hypothetical protein
MSKSVLIFYVCVFFIFLGCWAGGSLPTGLIILGSATMLHGFFAGILHYLDGPAR